MPRREGDVGKRGESFPVSFVKTPTRRVRKRNIVSRRQEDRKMITRGSLI